MLKQSCVRIKRVIFNGLNPVRPAICIWVVLLFICGRLAIGEVRIEYNPAGGLEPHAEALGLDFWSVESGIADFPKIGQGPLVTADPEMQVVIPRAKLKDDAGAAERYFHRDFSPEEFNDDTDLRIEALLRIKRSVKDLGSTCVQFTTPAGRTFGFGFFKVKDGDDTHVYFYADSGGPLTTTDSQRSAAWQCEPVVLGELCVEKDDEKRTCVLEILRNDKGIDDDIIRLSVEGLDKEPLTAKLSELAMRKTAKPGLLCGHPVNSTDDGKCWMGMRIKTSAKPPLDIQLFNKKYNFYRAGTGRYYRRRFEPQEFNDQTDLRIEATARVLSSIGSPASTCVQFTTDAGRTFGLGFLKDPNSHAKNDRIVLYADSGKELELYGYFYNWVDWLWKPDVLGTYSLPADEKRCYVLELLRKGKGPDDDIIRLSIKGSKLKPLTARLSELPTRPTVPGVVFGHPLNRGGGKAEWYDLTITTTGKPRPPAIPQRIGNKRQLFLDDWIIEKTEGLTRRLEKPEKYAGNPVMVLDKPWEKQHPVFNERIEPRNVAWNPELKKLQVFYMVPCEVKPGERGGAYLYADSSDGGRTWTKPNLGQVEFNGSKENNIIDSGGLTWRDEHEPDPSKRYKSFLSAMVSPDGKHWRESGLPVKELRYSSDTNPMVIWNPRTQKYIGYIRIRQTALNMNQGYRAVGCIESADYVNWSPPEMVFGDAREHIYSKGVTPYEGIYIGTPWFYWYGSDAPPDMHNPVISPGLAVSRDGWSWKLLTDARAEEEYIPTGPDGSIDDRQVRMASSLVVIDNKIVFVYGVNADPHVSTMRTKIGIATLRLDGFRPVAAGEKKGQLLTKPFVLEGNRLYINAACEKEGSITAAVLDENGKPLPGFGHEQCIDVCGDAIKLPVTWKGNSDLTRLQGRPVSLEFTLRKARLYSFWMSHRE